MRTGPRVRSRRGLFRCRLRVAMPLVVGGGCADGWGGYPLDGKLRLDWPALHDLAPCPGGQVKSERLIP